MTELGKNLADEHLKEDKRHNKSEEKDCSTTCCTLLFTRKSILQDEISGQMKHS